MAPRRGGRKCEAEGVERGQGGAGPPEKLTLMHPDVNNCLHVVNAVDSHTVSSLGGSYLLLVTDRKAKTSVWV